MFCEKGVCNFIKKETLTQVFSCEFCEISKNTFFYRTPLVAVSEGAITESELLKALTSKNDDKSPGNDGITKEPL